MIISHVTFWSIFIFLLVSLIAVASAVVATKLLNLHPVFFTNLVKSIYKNGYAIKNRIYPPNYVSYLRIIIPDAIYYVSKTCRRIKKTMKQVDETSRLKNAYNKPLNEDIINVATNPIKESAVSPPHADTLPQDKEDNN